MPQTESSDTTENQEEMKTGVEEEEEIKESHDENGLQQSEDQSKLISLSVHCRNIVKRLDMSKIVIGK